MEQRGVYLEPGHGILASIRRYFVQITWKIDIVEGSDASVRYHSFKAQLQYFVCQF